MSLDSDQIVVAASGALYVAPEGTTAPTDVETALDAAFVHLGYATEDGVSLSPGLDVEAFMSWQSLYPTRRQVTGRSFDIGVELQQWNQDTMQLAFGGGSFVETPGPPFYATYSPPSTSAIDFRSLVVEWVDGDKEYRLYLPKALVTEVGDIPLNRSNDSGIPLTFSLVATDGTDEFTIFTSDPAFDTA